MYDMYFRVLVNNGGSKLKSSIADNLLDIPLWHCSVLRCCFDKCQNHFAARSIGLHAAYHNARHRLPIVRSHRCACFLCSKCKLQIWSKKLGKNML